MHLAVLKHVLVIILKNSINVCMLSDEYVYGGTMGV